MTTSPDNTTYGYVYSHMRSHMRVTSLITLSPGQDYVSGTWFDGIESAEAAAAERGIVLVKTGVLDEMVYQRRNPSPRLPLATPVRLSNGVEAVICDYAANDVQRYRITWFNRRFWRVDYRWINREQFEVITEDEAERAR